MTFFNPDIIVSHHKSSFVNTLAFPILSIISEIKGNGLGTTMDGG